MRQRSLASLLILAACWGAVPALAQPPQRVVVISIDGLRPEFYLDPAHWEAPNLQRLKREGAFAERMLSIFPSITYANHTALVTGVTAARHGINSNVDFDLKLGPLPGWNWETHKIKVKALWDRAAERGVKTAAFSWPVSVGARIDYNVPEIFHVPGANDKNTEALIRQYATPGLMDELAPASRPFPESFDDWDAWLPGAAGAVWGKYQPQLTLIHMLNLDRTQHRNGRDAEATHQALTQLDAALGRLVAQLDPAVTTLLVVGDHGFADYQRFIAPNRLFLDRGWITLREGQLQSWRVLAHPNGASAPVYCQDPSLAKDVVAVLRENAQGRYEVLERAELDRLEAFPGALCALTMSPGYANRPDFDKPFDEATPRPLGNHGHRPELVPTGLIAWGRGVRAGSLGRIRLLDVAPTVCQLLNLDATGMLGRPLLIGE